MNRKFILLSFVAWLVESCPHGWNPSASDATKCYFVAQTKMTWQNAENYCKTLGPNSHLTSVLNSFETNDISAIVSTNPAIGTMDEVWIGAKGNNGDQKFFWSDGSSFVYQNWQTGQPNIGFPCVSSQARTSGRWATDSCETKNFAVCKYIMMPTKTPTDCYDYYFNKGNTTDGIYRVSPPGISPFDVWCDMTTDGGGWTVFQRRIDDSTIFWNRHWTDYKTGFNSGLANNLWLGLDRVNVLSTKDSSNILRIDLHGNRCKRTGSSYHCDQASDPNNGYWYGEWSSFSVESESNKYRLHISPLIAGNISASGSDPLYYFNNNQKFTTVDANNQEITAFNCAVYNEFGAWWYSGCSNFFLNGKYSATLGVGGYGFSVDHVQSTTDVGWVNPVRSEMKLRRNN